MGYSLYNIQRRSVGPFPHHQPVQEEFIPEGRDASQIYTEEAAPAKKSLSLAAWRKLTEWRAENEGSTTVKVAAEAGYFFSAIGGIVESAVKLPVAWIVGNAGSEKVAQGLNFFTPDDRILRNYERTRDACNDAFDQSLQGVAQNLVSTGTNLASHETNLKVAAKVKRSVGNEGNKAIRVIEAVSCTAVASAVYQRDPGALIGDDRDIRRIADAAVRSYAT